jgi:hypothetical protein
MAPYGWTCPCRKLKSDNIGDAVRRERRAPQFCHERLLRAQAAHPLQRGEVRSCDFNRMVLEFTMLNESKAILCAINTAAMDDLGRTDSCWPPFVGPSLAGCFNRRRQSEQI